MGVVILDFKSDVSVAVASSQLSQMVSSRLSASLQQRGCDPGVFFEQRLQRRSLASIGVFSGEPSSSCNIRKLRSTVGTELSVLVNFSSAVGAIHRSKSPVVLSGYWLTGETPKF